MVRCEVSGDQLCLRLRGWERLAALGGDVCVPLRCITAVDVVDKAWRQVDGLRVGTGLPGVVLAGRFYAGAVETIAVCRGRRPGIRVQLRGTSPGLLVATVAAPEQVAETIRSAAGLTAARSAD